MQPHTHYFVVSHLLIPGKQHTGANAEKFVHKVRVLMIDGRREEVILIYISSVEVVEVASAEGLMPLGLIHSCDDKFVCQRLKCRPAPTVATDGNAPPPPPITYPPPPIDHHNQYSACHHLFAQVIITKETSIYGILLSISTN